MASPFLILGSPKASFRYYRLGNEFHRNLGLSEELRQVDQRPRTIENSCWLGRHPSGDRTGRVASRRGLGRKLRRLRQGMLSRSGSHGPPPRHGKGKKEERFRFTGRNGNLPRATIGSAERRERGGLFEEHVHARGSRELEWQSFMKMEFRNWMKTVCLSATRKGEESKGCERRRIHQTSGEGFSKHGSRTRTSSENGKSTGQACRTKGTREQKLENHRITAVVGTFRLRSPRTAQTRRKGRFGRKITPKPRKNGVF